MFNNKVIKKPWGYEHLVYENEDIELWFLRIMQGESTSMHCHPKKTTGLILLKGEIKLSFLADSKVIKAPEKAMLRRGLFHSTKAISDGGAFIFELETPKDKNDLIRLSDEYGRSAMPYESETLQMLPAFTVSDPEAGTINRYSFAGCQITVESVGDVSIIEGKLDSDMLVFLRGGIVKHLCGETKFACMPGDVGFGKIVKKISSQLDGVAQGTVMMTIRK